MFARDTGKENAETNYTLGKIFTNHISWKGLVCRIAQSIDMAQPKQGLLECGW